MKFSSLLKSFAWRSFFQTIFFSTLLFLAFGYFFWKSKAFMMPITILEYAYLFAFLILYGILTWMFQKITLARLLSRHSERPPLKKKVLQELQTVDAQQQHRPRQNQNHEKRLFIHLFAVLQKEGRLLDFLNEDLSPYDDSQIGAAVRSVHENCRKTMDRYLSPEPILEKAEGGTVKIPDGFDQNAIKLVGNVVGEPPFTGIVRHRGWKFKSASLPKLSDAGNPEIIAPAEVEIQ
ncbi:conserved uncharacterized protein, DUF2760 [Desulfosarcina variabilis str. Montpellier]|jgi:hypothetical protein